MSSNRSDKDKPDAVGAPTATPEEVAELREAQETEYGTYVALTSISFNGVLAYTAGDPVPVTNVELHGYEKQGLVARIDSAEGKRLITAIHQQGAGQSTSVAAAQPISLAVHVPE